MDNMHMTKDSMPSARSDQDDLARTKEDREVNRTLCVSILQERGSQAIGNVIGFKRTLYPT
jgi:hypothetical protein